MSHLDSSLQKWRSEQERRDTTMTTKTDMSYEEALQRIQDRRAPDFWVGNDETLSAELATIERGTVRTLTETPGGHSIHVVSYGDPEPFDREANFNSAVAAKKPEQYADHARRDRPVVLLLGPVHGAETEGLTGLVNLLRILETGQDLRGNSWTSLRTAAQQCRLLVVPIGNPDALSRLEIESLNGLTRADLRFWGQGTWANGTFMGWPEAKQKHPMRGDDVGFLGGYFNDEGVNPMHDEFFDPMGPESSALLGLAREEAPDVTVSLHSHPHPPAFLRPAYLPTEVQREIRSLHQAYNDRLGAADLPAGTPFEVTSESGTPPPAFNLVSALYHTSGTKAFTHESPHGLVNGCQMTHDEILDCQLALYETVFRFANSG